MSPRTIVLIFVGGCAFELSWTNKTHDSGTWSICDGPLGVLLKSFSGLSQLVLLLTVGNKRCAWVLRWVTFCAFRFGKA